MYLFQREQVGLHIRSKTRSKTGRQLFFSSGFSMTGVCLAVSVQVTFWLDLLYGSRGNLLAGSLNGNEGSGLKRMTVLVISLQKICTAALVISWQFVCTAVEVLSWHDVCMAVSVISWQNVCTPALVISWQDVCMAMEVISWQNICTAVLLEVSMIGLPFASVEVFTWQEICMAVEIIS